MPVDMETNTTTIYIPVFHHLYQSPFSITNKRPVLPPLVTAKQSLSFSVPRVIALPVVVFHPDPGVFLKPTQTI